jgi:hypothetical protein
MRTVYLILVVLFFSTTAFASEIREFDIKTLEKLGNELARVSQQPDRGATTPVRKQARESTIAALKGKLFNIHYDYVVLDDPDGSGFLVYAFGSTGKRGETVLAGHFRVTVSADGEKPSVLMHCHEASPLTERAKVCRLDPTKSACTWCRLLALTPLKP